MIRLGQILAMLSGLLVDHAEEAIPLERRLAYAREERKKQLRASVDDGAKMGQYAGMITQQRAEMLIMLQNTKDDATAALQDAQQAQRAGNSEQEALHRADATRLAEEVVRIQSEIDSLDKDISEAGEAYEQAKTMILEMSRELQAQARGDMSLVARVARTDMREKFLQLREDMLGLTTTKDSAQGLRQRAIEADDKKGHYVDSRSDILNGLWQQYRGSRIADSRRASQAAVSVLDGLQQQIGYTPSAQLPAAGETQAAKAN